MSNKIFPTICWLFIDRTSAMKMYMLVIKFHFVVVDDRSVSFGWAVYVGLPNKSL